ncbi:glycosyltransferase [Marinobacter salinisoli]|uniref:Glycosyltransferase n=1 Tax=Marinobacter salinisoli TaxID=2769486 RepID=A0ABX7MN58_9GAMM|nr:glycosyltransferase [Marinobacter salinisoli]QSP93681.1 glycosyltransferase [Marinobacter salinisoli]
MESAKVEVTAVTFNDGMLSQKLRELGVDIDVADETALTPPQMIGIIRSHCRRHNTTVLHTHGFKENVLGIIAKVLARVPRSIRTVHGNPETPASPSQPLKWLIHQADLFLGRNMQQAVVAVSSQLEAVLTPRFPGQVQKIFNFVDVDQIRQQPPEQRRNHRSRPSIGLVGRLVPVKRGDIFLRTIALLHQKGISCSGIVVGTGPLESDLRQLASELKITDRLEFHGFVQPVLGVLKDLDVLVMPSDHEGLPMVLLEALALKIPIVAHRVGGISEVLADGRCGWLVEDHSPEGYAKVIADALQQPEQMMEKSSTGLRHVQKLFGARANIKLYEELYGASYTGSEVGELGPHS